VIVPLRAAGSKNPLFLVHGVDGDIVQFESLAGSLHTGQPVYGIRSQALQGESDALMLVEDMASYYLAALRHVQQHGPYCFLGFSFGALIAFEMANQLHAQGEQVGMLAMLDHRPMTSFSAFDGLSRTGSEVGPTAPRFNNHFKRLFAAGGFSFMREKLRARSLRTIYTMLHAVEQPIPRFLQKPYDINWFAAVRYVPVPYPGRIILFQTAKAIRDSVLRASGWENLAGAGVEVHEIAGSHEDVLEAPFVLALAKQLTECLEAVPHQFLKP
jgi:thioesterase domain-containing protein